MIKSEIKLLYSILSFIALSGCQAAAQKVYINVPQPCLSADQLPAQPVAKTDAELAKMTDSNLILNLAADRLEYRRFSNEAGALLVACAR